MFRKLRVSEFILAHSIDPVLTNFQTVNWKKLAYATTEWILNMPGMWIKRDWYVDKKMHRIFSTSIKDRRSITKRGKEHFITNRRQMCRIDLFMPNFDRSIKNKIIMLLALLED